MSTPSRGKKIANDANEKSPKNFRWAQPYEDTLIDLLVRESRKGNRPDSSFTATAFRNVVTDFNRIHGTCILKKHVLSRIKTMKQHFNQFHGAFNGLSGFSWNHDTKLFEAEDYLWEHCIHENPTLARFRDKPCHNWGTLLELYGDTRAHGGGSIGLRDKSATIVRGLQFAELCIDSQEINCGFNIPNECSSYADLHSGANDPAPSSTPNVGSTQQSGGSARSTKKRKASLISVLEDGYNTMAGSLHELSAALIDTGEKVAGSKYEPIQNAEIYTALDSLGLDEHYKVKCYRYLTSNPSKGAQITGAPSAIRLLLLEDIMKSSGD